MEVRVQEDYGLKEFVRHVADDIDHRCSYCYEHRIEGTARYAAEHGFTAFTSTLLASLYQDHNGIARAAEKYYAGPDPIGKTHTREGVVVRIINRPKFCAYKHKNFEFKVLEGIIKDSAEAPDMEEAQEEVAE
jgi:hypothetical protein